MPDHLPATKDFTLKVITGVSVASEILLRRKEGKPRNIMKID